MVSDSFGDGSLGSIAKSSPSGERRGLQAAHFSECVDSDLNPGVDFNSRTGEVTRSFSHDDLDAIIVERYLLQSAARRVLKGSKVKRIFHCLRSLYFDKNDKSREDFGYKRGVKVYRSKEHNTCAYGGLQTCASVWVCPVCAAKISERRKLELKHAIEQHVLNAGEVLLLTMTTPHYLCDKLSEVLDRQRQALVYFNRGGDVVRFNKSIGLIGQVRALEVTHGRLSESNNGWHPHYHILLFVNSGLNLKELRRAFYGRWLKACLRAGFSAPSFKHGVRLDDGSKAASYASKWGLENEMTKGHIKKARRGETPFDLLRAFALDNDKQAASLFREFSEVFKGKSQLFWSHGLKDKFCLKEFSDDLLAAQQDDSAFILGTIDLDDWRLILKHDFRAEILNFARRRGWEYVERFLINLRLGYS